MLSLPFGSGTHLTDFSGSLDTVDPKLPDLIRSRNSKDLIDLYYEPTPGVRVPIPVNPATNVPEGFQVVDSMTSASYRDSLGHGLVWVVRDVIEEPYLVSFGPPLPRQ